MSRLSELYSKDGWRIADQHFRLAVGKRNVYVDLRAVHAVNGTSRQIMLVEVKCFPDSDTILQELYTAVGQYLFYRVMLNMLDDPTPLYMSIPQTVFESELDETASQFLRETRIRLIIVNLEEERIVQWINTWN